MEHDNNNAAWIDRFEGLSGLEAPIRDLIVNTAYWLATAPAPFFQIAMIILLVQLHRLHFADGAANLATMLADLSR